MVTRTEFGLSEQIVPVENARNVAIVMNNGSEIVEIETGLPSHADALAEARALRELAWDRPSQFASMNIGVRYEI